MKKRKTTLYFAYGANTNEAGMARRCPDAVAIRPARLLDHRLVFRGVADVVESTYASVPGVLWEITERCERSLDRFEGFPHLYKKGYRAMTVDGKRERVMFYTMVNKVGQHGPPKSYESKIREGYRSFGLDTAELDEAIERSREYEHESGEGAYVG